MNETSFATDMLTEKDKITFAMDLAIAEVTRRRKGKQDDADADLDGTQADIDLQKKVKKKGFLGVAASIKLPFVIGQPEYYSHDYAGLVFVGNEELDQLDHHKEEMAMKDEDKIKEKMDLAENAANYENADDAMVANEERKKQEEAKAEAEAVSAAEKARKEAEEAARYVDIPEPPEDEAGDWGKLPPPEGFAPAYCPALREGKIINGRGGAPAAAPQGQAAPAPAPIQVETLPEVKAEQIPAEIRQSLAQAGMPVETMTKEARMSVALMASQHTGTSVPVEGGPAALGPEKEYV